MKRIGLFVGLQMLLACGGQATVTDKVGVLELDWLEAETVGMMSGLRLDRVGVTIDAKSAVRNAHYRKEFGCVGNYIGCTKADGKKALIGWDNGDPSFAFNNADTFAHELAHAWLKQTTGTIDAHHTRTDIFGIDDEGNQLNPGNDTSLTAQIAADYFEHLNAEGLL